MVLQHRLEPRDPRALKDTAFDRAAEALLLADAPVPLAEAERVLAP